MSRCLLLLCVAAIFLGGGLARAETAKQAVDRVWNAYIDDVNKRKNDPALFSKAFLRLCQKTANEQGVAVIKPIMERAKNWKSEESIIFTPLIVFLPQDKSAPILEAYKKTGKPWEQTAAYDFLAEMHQSDTQAMVREMSKE